MDLDGDGINDIISGSWPGELYFFKGGPNQEFADGVKLRDKDGKLINPGGGVRKQDDGSLMIAGDAEFKESEGDNAERTVVYDGETIKVEPGKEAFITGAASAVFAVDWRQTGKLDLIVGEIGGRVFLVPNEGTKVAWSFGKAEPLSADGKAIQVEGGDAGPAVADWDGDGKLDLIVGCGDGSVLLYKNVGSRQKPELAAPVTLVPPGEAEHSDKAPKDPRRGVRAKVCVVDYDGDGKLDLLVGDMATQKPDLPEPTEEQKKEHGRLRTERDELMKEYQSLVEKIVGPDKAKSKEEKAKHEKNLTELRTRLEAIVDKLPKEYEDHGWVWFFKRK